MSNTPKQFHSEDIGLHLPLVTQMGGWEQSISTATAFGRDLHFICTCAEYRPACVARSWVLGGQWTMGVDRWQCCDHRPPYQHQHQPCNSLPSSARTRPIYEVPRPHHTLPIKVVFCPIGMFYPSPRFSARQAAAGAVFAGFFSVTLAVVRAAWAATLPGSPRVLCHR